MEMILKQLIALNSRQGANQGIRKRMPAPRLRRIDPLAEVEAVGAAHQRQSG